MKKKIACSGWMLIRFSCQLALKLELFTDQILLNQQIGFDHEVLFLTGENPIWLSTKRIQGRDFLPNQSSIFSFFFLLSWLFSKKRFLSARANNDDDEKRFFSDWHLSVFRRMESFTLNFSARNHANDYLHGNTLNVLIVVFNSVRLILISFESWAVNMIIFIDIFYQNWISFSSCYSFRVLPNDFISWANEKKYTLGFQLKKKTSIDSSLLISGQLTPSNLTAYIVNTHTLSVTWDLPSNVNAIEKVYITATELGSKNRTILSQSLDNTVKKLDIPIHPHNPSSKSTSNLAFVFFIPYWNSFIFFVGIHPNRTVLFSARCSDRNGQNSSIIEYQLYVNMFSKFRFLPFSFSSSSSSMCQAS